MSTASAVSTRNAAVNNFNGGEPISKDLVPAIVFSALLAVSVPLLLWRLLSKKHRTRVLLNSLMFFLTRLASLILRAYMSKRTYGEGILIAELILVSIAYLFLVNALIDLWQHHHAEPKNDGDGWNTMWNDEKKNKATWVTYFAWFLRAVLLAAFATAIAAGAMLRKRLTTEEKTSLIRNLIKASYILALATTVLGILTTLITHFTKHRPVKKTAFLLGYSIPLLVVGIYRVVTVFTGYSATTRQLTAFWVAMITFEVISYSILLAISIPKFFAKHLHAKGTDVEKRPRGSSSMRESDSVRR